MLRQEFEVTLLDNIILSQTSATMGQHQSLEYIPGAVFLGIAASQLYATLSAESQEKVWEVFHSGNYRFGNATLTINEEKSYPVPMCLHTIKGENWQKTHSDDGLNYPIQGCLLSFLVDKSAIDEKLKSKQPVQVRSGYMNSQFAIESPIHHYEMKTAVSANSNVAAKEQLFGYQSLKSGQSFRFVLEADTNDAETFNKIVKGFNGQIRIGRSRSAQFGRAQCKLLQPESSTPYSNVSDSQNQFSFVCTSDVALIDEKGMASFLPQAEQFGLPPQWQYDLSNSFIRTRSYSPYNGYRRTYDLERQVIQQGSVITFKGAESATTQSELKVGAYQEQGLGAVKLVPDTLNSIEVKIEKQDTGNQNQSNKHTIKAPDTKLINWVLIQNRPSNCNENWLEKMLQEYPVLLQTSRRFNGIPKNINIGPSASQWGAVLTALKDNRRASDSEITRILFDQKQGICRSVPSDELAWGLEVIDGHSEKPIKLGKWLQARVEHGFEAVTDSSQNIEALNKPEIIPTLLAFVDKTKRDPYQQKTSNKEVAHV